MRPAHTATVVPSGSKKGRGQAGMGGCSGRRLTALLMEAMFSTERGGMPKDSR
jgi:hypothetical protein